MKKFFSNAKTKVLAGLGVGVAAASNAAAAVVYDSASGQLTGTIDMAGYNSALTIIIPAAVTIVVGGIILRTIKKI